MSQKVGKQSPPQGAKGAAKGAESTRSKAESTAAKGQSFAEGEAARRPDAPRTFPEIIRTSTSDELSIPDPDGIVTGLIIDVQGLALGALGASSDVVFGDAKWEERNDGKRPQKFVIADFAANASIHTPIAKCGKNPLTVRAKACEFRDRAHMVWLSSGSAFVIKEADKWRASMFLSAGNIAILDSE